LYGEKIDVIEWSPDLPTFISNALSPAKPISVSLNDDEKVARVIVPTEQMSLAIGKDGQNARLAYKLTGWRIDIKDPEALRASGDDDILRRAREALASGPDDMMGLGRQPRLVHAGGTINVREKEFGPLTPDLVNMSVDVEVENGVLNVYYNRDLRARFDYETGDEIPVTEEENSQVGSERPA
jgi:N utilization substance protein A